MTEDLPERLRIWPPSMDTVTEAANEIERLKEVDGLLFHQNYLLGLLGKVLWWNEQQRQFIIDPRHVEFELWAHPRQKAHLRDFLDEVRKKQRQTVACR